MNCKHPNLSGNSSYVKGCRCDRCKADSKRLRDAAKINRLAKAKAAQTDPNACLFPHITSRGAWTSGCRCRRCKDGINQYNRRYYAKRLEEAKAAQTDPEACLFPNHKPITGHSMGCRCRNCKDAYNKQYREYCKERTTEAKAAQTDPNACLFPHLKGVTGHSMGCRCERCKEALRVGNRNLFHTNPEWRAKRNAESNQYRIAHKNDPEFRRKKNTAIRRWQRANWDRVRAHCCNASNKRRQIIKNQTPLTPEEKQRLTEIYLECRRMNNAEPGKYHVDHIKPINVGGLHHPDNLRIIIAEENLRRPHDGSDIPT